jgi:arginine exporter protein ArgO
MSPFLLGLIAGYGIAVPVGAIAVLILETGLRRGLRPAMAAGGGAASADVVYASLAAAVGEALAPAIQAWGRALSVAGGATLVAIGGLMLWRLRRNHIGSRSTGPAYRVATDPQAGPVSIYLKFLGLTLLNPQTIVYFSSLVLGGGPGRPSADRMVLFVLGAGLASLSWQWLLAGVSSLGRKALPQSMRVATTLLGSLIVSALGVRMILAG